METPKGKILLAVHDESLIRSFPRLIRAIGYETDLAKDRSELLEKANQKGYRACIMDVNFERPGSYDLDISKRVYGLLNKDASVRFMAISGDPDIVEEANKQGIPTEYKTSFDMIAFLRQ
jgi:DNA-binding NtrC family response regulator